MEKSTGSFVFKRMQKLTLRNVADVRLIVNNTSVLLVQLLLCAYTLFVDEWATIKEQIQGVMFFC